MAVLLFDTETSDKNQGEVVDAAWLRLTNEDDEDDELPPTVVSRYPNDVTNEAAAEDIGT